MGSFCKLTGKSAISGNNVSHSKRRTKRRFSVNIVNVKLFSSSLKRYFILSIAASTLRTIDFKGDLDCFLKETKNWNLTSYARKMKKSVMRAESETL